MTDHTDAGLRVERVTGKKGLKSFVNAGRPIYADDPVWSAPLMFERMGVLDSKKNPYFDHAEAAFWIATRDGEPVGRISAQVDQLAQIHHGQDTGHFGFVDAFDDPAIFELLFQTAEAWLREKGMTRALGPFNLSINEECGLLIDGFEHPPRIMMGHARPYYAAHYDRQGYGKAVDTRAYDLQVTTDFPEPAQRILRRARKLEKLTLRRLEKKNFNEDLRTCIEIFNDAWQDNWGYIPMTDAEIEKLGADFKLFLRTEGCMIAYWDGKPAAFMFTIPDVNEAFADFNGSLWPFNWAKLLKRLIIGVPKGCRVPLMGVRKEFQGKLPGVAMAMLLIETIRKAAVEEVGYTRAELSWILEDNDSMWKILDLIGCVHYKTYRIYEKRLP